MTLLGSARFSHCDPLEEKEKYQTPQKSIVRQTGQQCVDPGVFHLSHTRGYVLSFIAN